MQNDVTRDAGVHPLTAMATRLHAIGVAGYEGEAEMNDGAAEFSRLRIKGPGVDVEIEGDTVILRASLPESMVAALAGRTLGEVASLPTCGDADVDAAVAGMRIAAAHTGTKASDAVVVLGMDGVRPVGHVQPEA